MRKIRISPPTASVFFCSALWAPVHTSPLVRRHIFCVPDSIKHSSLPTRHQHTPESEPSDGRSDDGSLALCLSPSRTYSATKRMQRATNYVLFPPSYCQCSKPRGKSCKEKNCHNIFGANSILRTKIYRNKDAVVWNSSFLRIFCIPCGIQPKRGRLPFRDTLPPPPPPRSASSAIALTKQQKNPFTLELIAHVLR